MQILITGNMGYVGPSVVAQLRSAYPNATLVGFDTAYFSTCLTTTDFLPERWLDKQVFGDMRQLPSELLKDVDIVVHLAAISNDPMGNIDEQLTMDVNYRATIMLAKRAKLAGVQHFILASSCSVYGAGEHSIRTEESEINPLTIYAKSKVLAEQDLLLLVDNQFAVTCLRFPTACGMSSRLRLDLVLNDFVASALTAKKITILSDGSPWRPLIHVNDMARAIQWAMVRNVEQLPHLIVNVGSGKANYQVKELAEAVATFFPEVDISINQNALLDRRSYRVNFDRYQSMAPVIYQPHCTLFDAIRELKEGLEAIHFQDQHFRQSHLIRLNHLTYLKEKGLLNTELYWM